LGVAIHFRKGLLYLGRGSAGRKGKGREGGREGRRKEGRLKIKV